MRKIPPVTVTSTYPAQATVATVYETNVRSTNDKTLSVREFLEPDAIIPVSVPVVFGSIRGRATG